MLIDVSSLTIVLVFFPFPLNLLGAQRLWEQRNLFVKQLLGISPNSGCASVLELEQ